jgi:sirohydrochlorin cobaltochelatase
MSGRALVVAAHGSSEPGVNEGVRRLALRVGGRLRFDEAIAAFHRGEPRFESALDALRSDDVVVVPLLQSEGYYCHRVLPAELARNRRFASLRLRQTRAVGVHPGVGEGLARRVVAIASRYSLRDPAIAMVGHGTPRHRGSRQAAEATARDVERRSGCAARAYFLDEEPAVESIAADAPGRDLIVMPLLIGAGRHASRDLARRLGLSGDVIPSSVADGGSGVDAIERGAGRLLVVDRPFGLDPAVEEIVCDLAGGSGAGSAERSPGTAAQLVAGASGGSANSVNLPSAER